MKTTDTDVRKFLTKLYRFLGEPHIIEFKKLQSNRGHIQFYQNGISHITLDHRDEIVPTLIHEVLHHLYPTMSEDWILAKEDAIVKKLTQRQVRNILKRLAIKL